VKAVERGRDGVAEVAEDAESTGVFVPDETAESPALAGVVGGGSGPEGESEKVDHGRVRSGDR